MPVDTQSDIKLIGTGQEIEQQVQAESSASWNPGIYSVLQKGRK